MNRAISGHLTVAESGRPLKGVRVVAAKAVHSGMEVLGEGTSSELGYFRVTYSPLDASADLTLLVFSPGGHLMFTEPWHRAIDGSELRLHVEVPEERVAVLAN